MKWVVLAILLFVAIQTVVNLEFRKPERAHEPAAEAAERAKRPHFVNASMNGWMRLASTIEAQTSNAPAGVAELTKSPTLERFDREVPLELAGRMPRKPALFPAPTHVAAPATNPRASATRIALTYAQPAALPRFGEPWTYAKERQLFIFLQDENELPPDGKPIAAAPAQSLVLDTSTLEPGRWTAKFFTREMIYAWSFTIER